MVRIVLALLIGAALAFAGSWVVFEGLPGSGVSEKDVEAAVAQRAASNGTEVSSVACVELVEPKGVWTCSVNGSGVVLTDPIDMALALDVDEQFYRARVLKDEIVVEAL